MIENDMKRNGSGYIDETPVKSGVLTGPQAGEIWGSDMGKEFLILKNHGTFCTVLHLKDARRDGMEMEIQSRCIMYTNPAMVQYMFRSNLAQFIKNVAEEQYFAIMQAVSERLGVTIRVSGSNGHNLEELTTAGNEDLLGECARLECRLEESYKERKVLANHLEAAKEELYQVKEASEKTFVEMTDKIKALEAERDLLKDDLHDSEEMYHLACKTCNEEKAAKESAEATARNIHNAYKQAEEKAATWEKMHNALLDRLFARGEAK